MHERGRQYIAGLYQADRSNMMQMEEVVPGASEQSLQYLLSEGSWDHRQVLGKVRQEADALLGGHEDSCLILDESAMAKKGKCSAGVARQYNGRLGKVDNCQVGVFAVLSRQNLATLIDARLYLPQCWIDDPERCRKAKVPEGEIRFLSKTGLALETVDQAHAAGIRFSWVLADGGYGKEPQFLRELADEGRRFVVDVHSTQRIYLTDPRPIVPERCSDRGRHPTQLVTEVPSMTVEAWAAQQPENAWQLIEVRDTTQGILRVRAIHRRVWLWDGQEAQARCWTVLVIRDMDQQLIHYALSNAPDSTPLETLVRRQRQRFWIEHHFGEAKSELGLHEYEVRTWHGWHRHMALCSMALLFITKEKIRHQNAIPLLSARDIVQSLAYLLPRRDADLEELARIITERHRLRAADIARRRKAQADRDAMNPTK